MEDIEYLILIQYLKSIYIQVSTNSLSSDTIFSFSVIVILSSSNVLSLSMVSLFSRIAYAIVCYTFNIKVIKSFLIFRSSLNQIFRCFLFATCDDIVLSCLNLFNNLDLVMIAFIKFLFTNVTWLYLKCFCF